MKISGFGETGNHPPGRPIPSAGGPDVAKARHPALDIAFGVNATKRAGLKHSAPKAGKAAQLDGQVISHTGGHFALLSILFEQVYFGLVPKRVGSTIRPTRRLPEFIGAPSNFVFG
jgi:hypothetical protein